ncbi:hypothetical protein VDIAB_220019 [Vibrio diabolicus]|nr:hypothetical protein VDIAB_220019 [Vibrio diabolicus]
MSITKPNPYLLCLTTIYYTQWPQEARCYRRWYGIKVLVPYQSTSIGSFPALCRVSHSAWV